MPIDPFESLQDLPSFCTDRFTVRPIARADMTAIFAIFSDPEVTRYWSFPAMRDRTEAEKFVQATIDGFRSRDLLEWGIVQRGEEELIGTCALSGWSRLHRRAEIGYALRRDRWGKGIMAEVLPALLRFGFTEMNLHRVEADVDPRNTASIRSLERLGFQREGYLRERYFLNGEIQDAIFYGLLRQDFFHSDKMRPHTSAPPHLHT